MDKLREICSKTFTPEEMQTLDRAIEFTKQVHAHQTRHSGEPYYTHPENVAIMLANMGMDSHTILAGLMHDVIEDGKDITYEKLASMFGQDIAGMVDGVTKLTKTGKNEMISREDIQAESFRKMFLAIANDIRVVIIKLNDRLHNMRTLQYCSEEKQIRKARETLDIYAPLAHRFGMGAMKCELEDLCMKYLWPEEYKKLEQAMIPYQEERMHTLNKAMEEIEKALKEAGIEATLSGRPKHFYSIYKKTVRQQKTIDEIYDLIAIRVIVNTVNDCYATLGIIHSLWKPMPGRFKDYIAMPKTNMYRSLHTTLFSNDGMGMPFEVQIRTPEMHKAAEYGIAAHWMYKEGRNSPDDLDSKLAWLREALSLEADSNTTREFIENIRKDFFGDYVYVLTPQGKIIDLVTGSTPIDFAYRIHSNVGNHVQHAKVNGALVRLDYKLKNNDVVEIITSPNATPSYDWLKIAKTQQAKAKIRTWFKKANREENIQRGKDMLSEALKRQGAQLGDFTGKKEYFEDILKKFNMSDLDDVYASIGYGGITTGQVTNKLLEQAKKEAKAAAAAERLERLEEEQQSRPENRNNGKGVIVEGDTGMVVRFARCCTPLPGDDIIGYVTRGRGVSIHRRDCPNIEDLLMDPERVVKAEWANNAKSSYTATIQVVADERTGLLMDVSQVLAGMNISITAMTAKVDKANQNIIQIQLSFDVSSTEQLNNIIKSMRKVRSVKEVYRVNQ
ncbi:MAG: bifunctional (p)ppGpp synthetase/guanosine-3',5'-bis(diphosphate) 3'-pyrophosphohydrolase [Eubacteriales bacterium]|nr:bifunctional (p)ppGpp synthetase/guanosine-3',5'-bis(diphosphate) 3'-pyrophosphohydrolase [Eubacteriales bacterium]MCI6634281.1 bifunctional (p)ppGpp synthetase/guanosine-3',5'-bis(diphosphate) 3'-pyrophosphohydrolase [Clostridiales bacterium]MCI6961235.1 bifunctional (p)ppGpp synthetase/guanosine-3',5'-bis(diphosphate) 3'-pyrophosphohydrolase [Clostridiales bacterium]MDD6013227.1 bifunctional (p)ppGpp synthetase/guanosine-3',5'-bis(diphosphate) 3'-pyrophosphohydrolase [Clostridiales bacteriu